MSSYPMFSPEAGMITCDEFIKVLSTELISAPLVRNNNKLEYINLPAAFDIETTSFYENEEKRACMYIWMFGILNWVTYGRTWDEFDRLLKIIRAMYGLSTDRRRLIVYVHNLPYEFQFMRKRFKWDNVFLMEPRKPVYAVTDGIEFRCSLKLSNKSLENVSNDLIKYKVNKMVGDLDYTLKRHSQTEMTPTELKYCENDVRVILSYIQEKIESDKSIANIPLTLTGYVRRYCKESCFNSNYKMYKKLMSELTLTSDEYSQLKRAFAGGFTHANARKAMKVHTEVASYDFTSSYPSVMVTEKFPMSKSKELTKIKDIEELESYLKKFCCLFDIRFRNLESVSNSDHPISMSKCRELKNPFTDNGRVVAADSLVTTITEQDYWTFKRFYKWDSIDISKFRYYEKGYLPKAFILSILDLYKTKTELKGVKEKEIEYMVRKNMLNGAYGMSVTDIVRPTVTYERDEFSSTEPDLEDAISRYNKSGKRFLFYPWGVWVTAYARANLFSAIYACGDDYLYGDTDSVKILNPELHKEYFETYNKNHIKKIEESAKFYNISTEMYMPKNIKGNRKIIGLWDYEGTYDKFKTLGAKRYFYEENGQYYLTVAGVNKKKACDYIVKTYENPFDAFNDGLVVPVAYSGRQSASYIDEEHEGSLVDYTGLKGNYHELSAIHLEGTDYSLGMTAAYINYILGFSEELL